MFLAGRATGRTGGRTYISLAGRGETRSGRGESGRRANRWEWIIPPTTNWCNLLPMDQKETIKRGRELRSKMSPPEVILWKLIRRDQLGYRVRRQQPFEGYFLDFYIRALMVAIEVDGRIHEGQNEYDQFRDSILESKGVTIIRIPARSIFEDPASVVDFLVVRLAEIANSK